MKRPYQLLGVPFVLGFMMSGGGAGAQYVLEPVGTFSTPVFIHAIEGDDRLFVVEQGGRIRIVEGGAVLGTPFLDISTLLISGGERGLLSMAFHPNYAQNGFFFVNYTRTGDGATVIARYRVSADANVADAGSGVILLQITQDFSNHNGGQLQFGPDGYLYVGMGDGGSGGDPRCRAQSTNTLLGKMLRLDVDQNVDAAPHYGIPGDNPFVGAGDPRDEVWAVGVRNPWRFSFDRNNGDLWIADVGQNVWEEINHTPAGTAGGLNYGWAVKEGLVCFNPSTAQCPAPLVACSDASLVDPVHVYDHSGGRCSVSGGYVYRGLQVPGLVGLYLFADYCTGEIFSYDRETNTATMLIDAPGNVATFGEDGFGELYVNVNNVVHRFTQPGATPLPSPTPTPQPSDNAAAWVSY